MATVALARRLAIWNESLAAPLEPGSPERSASLPRPPVSARLPAEGPTEGAGILPGRGEMASPTAGPATTTGGASTSKPRTVTMYESSGRSRPNRPSGPVTVNTKLTGDLTEMIEIVEGLFAGPGGGFYPVRTFEEEAGALGWTTHRIYLGRRQGKKLTLLFSTTPGDDTVGQVMLEGGVVVYMWDVKLLLVFFDKEKTTSDFESGPGGWGFCKRAPETGTPPTATKEWRGSPPAPTLPRRYCTPAEATTGSA